MAFDLSNVGLPKANPDASGDSIYVIEACNDCGTYSVCEDAASGALASSVNLTAFSYTPVGGAAISTTVSPTTGVDEPAALEAAILAVISQYEINPIVNVSYSGGVFSISHIGAGTLGGVTLSSGTLTFERRCVPSEVCTFTFSVVGATTANNAAGEEVLSETYEFGNATTNTTTIAAIAADFEGVFVTEGLGYHEVTAVANATDEDFDVTIVAARGFEFWTVDGDRPTKSDCAGGFVA